MNYHEKALCFAKKYGVTLKVKWLRYDDSMDSYLRRHIFKCRLSRGKNNCSITYGQALSLGSTEPTIANILSIMQKYDVGSYEEYLKDFGDMEYPKQHYYHYKKEYAAIERLFGDLPLEGWDELREFC